MDLVELRAGATIWFPVEVEGGLLSLGDLHARMGRGEPLGSGLECGGMVIGTICLEPNARPSGPVLCDDRRITFVGTSDVDWRDAERKAVRAAWDWLTGVCGVPQDDAIVLSATLLEVNAGGPAGNNAVASIAINELVRANVRTDVWPLAIARNS
jgi:acetamidase/formamidase